MSDDLYGDLDTSTSALEKKEAVDLQRKAERENEALRRELAQLQSQNRQLGQANQALETNMSKLFATAQNEIKRKDKEVQRLREALDAAQQQPQRSSAPSRERAQYPSSVSSSGGGHGHKDGYSSKSPSHSRQSSSSERHRDY